MGTKQHQGGSLGVYVVVAVLLGLALVGGLYGLQRYNASKTVAATDESTKKREEPSKDKEKTTDKSDPKTNTGDTPVASDDKTAAPSPSTNENKQPASEKEGSATAELPTTGPAEVISQLVAIGALSFAGVAFFGSAQHRWTSRGN